MHFEISISLIITVNLFYTVKGDHQKWYLTYVSITDFTSTASISTFSEGDCAKYATQQQWPKLLRFDAGTCYLSTLEKAAVMDGTLPAGHYRCLTSLFILGKIWGL